MAEDIDLADIIRVDPSFAKGGPTYTTYHPTRMGRIARLKIVRDSSASYGTGPLDLTEEVKSMVQRGNKKPYRIRLVMITRL